MGGFLDYVPGGSFLHRLNPLTKLFLSLLLCMACFLSNRHLFVVGIILLNLCMAACAGIFSRALRMLRALIKLSAFFFLLQIFFVRDGNILLSLPFGLFITDKGFSFSLLFVLRLIAATMPLALMLSITRMSDLANVLVEKAGVPYKYAFALTTAIRFIPIFSSEMSGIMEAQTARGIEFDTKNFFKKIRLLLPLCVPLLISSVKRIDGGAISAELRGFNLRRRGQGYKVYRFAARDYAVFLLSFAIAAAAILL